MTDSPAERALLAPRTAAADEPAWLADLRAECAEAFAARGLPTRRDEDWRYTDLDPLRDVAFGAPGGGGAAEAIRHEADLDPGSHQLVFEGGRLRPELCAPGTLPDGLELRALGELLREAPERLAGVLGACADPKRRALTALNTARFEDGAFVQVATDAAIDAPIHLVFVEADGATPSAAHPRNVVVVGAGARVAIIEHYVGRAPGGGLTNPVTEVRVGRGARVEHVSLQEQAPESFHLAELAVRQERDSVFRSHAVALGGRLARLDLGAALEGEGAHAELLGAYFGRARQHQDFHTSIDHASPRTTSRELYKGILDERARGVFHGRIHVRPDAQRIDAQQTNRTLLLSDEAQIVTKPQLEIYADDVKCSHGATVGALDPDQLFYLRARGIEPEDARTMLTSAFAGEVLHELPVEALRSYLDCFVLGWLSGGER